MANNQAFLVCYSGTDRYGNIHTPYKAIAHSADEAIAVINTWKTYGNHKVGNNDIVVNEISEKKIRELFSKGSITTYEGVKTNRLSLRTTGCGCWDITFYPALADTLEEHDRIYNEQREAAKQERLRQSEIAKQRRIEELNEQKRGWYHVELELCLSVFNNRGNDYRTDQTFSGNVIADSGADAYNKAVAHIESHPDELEHRGNMAILETYAEATSHGYEFTFLGVKTDYGYSVEKWEEWKKNGEI